jgi:hypothetical protein
MAAGAAAVLAGRALIDVATGQAPFEWLFANVRLNLIENKSARFGVAPADYYFGIYRQHVGVAGLFILGLALLTWRRHWLLLSVAAVNIAVHSAVGHKEYRFIALSSAILVILAAIGSVTMVFDWLDKRGASEAARARAAVVLIALWGAASLATGWSQPLEEEFGGLRDGYTLSRRAGDDPGVCGIAMMGIHYTATSHAYLGRPMAIYVLPTGPTDKRLAEAPPGRAGASFNAVIAAAGNDQMLPGYRRVACGAGGATCLYRRPGGCSATPEAVHIQLSRHLARIGL